MRVIYLLGIEMVDFNISYQCNLYNIFAHS